MEAQTRTQSVTLPRKSPTNLTADVNIAHQCRDLKLLSHSAACVCRMDDLAVDSDEEVDYSKMDQVTTDQLKFFLVAAGGAVAHSKITLLSVSGE